MSVTSRLRRIAGRVADRVVLWAPTPPPGLRSPQPKQQPPTGAVAPGTDLRDPVLVLLTGLAGDAVAPLIGELARLPQAGGVVLVMDQPRFADATRAGFPVEHVIHRDAWQVRHPDLPWEEHLAVRVRQLQDLYRAREVLVAAELGDRLVERLSGRAPVPGARRLARAALAAGLRRIDPPVRAR